jgi:hypothetical protein
MQKALSPQRPLFFPKEGSLLQYKEQCMRGEAAVILSSKMILPLNMRITIARKLRNRD